MIDPYLLFVGAIAAGAGYGTYALTMRDFIRRGRLHRRGEELLLRGAIGALPEGRVPCPKCAEAILPAARRCPYCRSDVTLRV